MISLFSMFQDLSSNGQCTQQSQSTEGWDQGFGCHHLQAYATTEKITGTNNQEGNQRGHNPWAPHATNDTRLAWRGMQKITWDPKPFYHFREHLAIEHSCIIWKGRFFIPITLRQTCLKALHHGHPDVNKMLLRT